MSSFDDFARLCAEELRTAANLDRTGNDHTENSGEEAAQNVAGTHVVASLRSIAKLLGEMRDSDKKRIMELTAQRLGVDHEKLKNAFDAVASKNALDALHEIRYLIDHAT
jgi:hypothetical protein